MRQVSIFDTTLRDGEQAPGASLSPQAKFLVAKALADLGVDVIEAGFPAASVGEAEAVARIAREVRGPTMAALARQRLGRRGCGEVALRSAPLAHSRVHRHERSPPRAKAPHLAIRVPRAHHRGGRPRD